MLPVSRTRLTARLIVGWAAIVLATPLVAEETGAASAGQPVNGLQVRAQATDAAWPLGSALAVEVTLTNVSDQPVLVDLFGDLNALYEGKHPSSILPSCWALIWNPPAMPDIPHRGRYTLDASQFHRLAPGESVTTRLTLALSGVAAGTYHVKVAYAPRMASPSFSLPDHWETQHRFTDRMWVGMAFSNPLTVHVVNHAR